MISGQRLVWYASYGSNLLEERFHCYIRGGQPPGATKSYAGCKDKTLPISNEELYIMSELYFAKSSGTWQNGGVAFIDINFDQGHQTFARMYLITEEQFIEVVKQEIDHKGELHIDFDSAERTGSHVFKRQSWYGNIIYLGNQDGHSMFTFTNETNIWPTTKPSQQYLKMIIGGIKETFAHLSDNEILEYLLNKKGIAGNYSNEELIQIIGND